jgi:hypothetical protein
MAKANTQKKLAETKLALAAKCDRLIQATKSKPRKTVLTHQAARFRRQAADLLRQS